MSVTIHSTHMDGIRSAGEQAFPNECCGFLLGRIAEGHKKVAELLPAENDREEGARHHRYSISPMAFLEGEKFARAKGLDIIGFYHSHPNAPSRPSAYDTEHAWPWYSYIIVSVDEGTAALATSWVLRDDRSTFDEEPLQVEG